MWTQLKEEAVYERQVQLKEEMRKERLVEEGKKERVTEEELMIDLCEDMKEVGDTNSTGREDGA